MAYNILQSITLLGNGANLLAAKAVAGFTVNAEHISDFLNRNPALITVLTPKIGYDKAAGIVERAFNEKRSIKDIASEELKMPKEEITRILNPLKMVQKGIIG
jgi:fumarate hydratase class II